LAAVNQSPTFRRSAFESAGFEVVNQSAALGWAAFERRL
jgi:hypothetical protein